MTKFLPCQQPASSSSRTRLIVLPSDWLPPENTYVEIVVKQESLIIFALLHMVYCNINGNRASFDIKFTKQGFENAG